MFKKIILLAWLLACGVTVAQNSEMPEKLDEVVDFITEDLLK